MVKQIQLLFGLIWYLCKFIWNFSAIVEPLHKLIYKNELFVWTDLCQQTFRELKCHVVSAPMLEIYNSSTDTKVEVRTNAGAKALSAILLKYIGAKLFYRLAYYSKKYNNV